MVDTKAFYKLGFELALRTHGMRKAAEQSAAQPADRPAEALAATLGNMPTEAVQIDAAGKRNDKDPKDPDDSQTWSSAGPFGGDSMSAMGLVPEAISGGGY